MPGCGWILHRPYLWFVPHSISNLKTSNCPIHTSDMHKACTPYLGAGPQSLSASYSWRLWTPWQALLPLPPQGVSLLQSHQTKQEVVAVNRLWDPTPPPGSPPLDKLYLILFLFSPIDLFKVTHPVSCWSQMIKKDGELIL